MPGCLGEGLNVEIRERCRLELSAERAGARRPTLQLLGQSGDLCELVRKLRQSGFARPTGFSRFDVPADPDLPAEQQRDARLQRFH